MRSALALAMIACVALPTAAGARESLGVFGQWGAFRDPETPRCYAITTTDSPRAEHAAFASVGTWPRQQLRGQFHIRLSRTLAARSAIRLAVGAQRFELVGGGADAWARDVRMDAALAAAMRSASAFSVSATDRAGRRFTDRYSLDGAATALDAATIGCARIRPSGR